MVLRPAGCKGVVWTKTSTAASGSMKPNPFLAVTDLAVPFDIFSRKPRAGISDTIADEV
jgi:hypothetical protein